MSCSVVTPQKSKPTSKNSGGEINSSNTQEKIQISSKLVSPTSVAMLALKNSIPDEEGASSNLNNSLNNSNESKMKKKKKKNDINKINQMKSEQAEYVNVEILIPSKPSSKFQIPTLIQFQITADLLELREDEMRSIANDALIPLDRWSGSLIYRKWKAESALALHHSATKKNSRSTNYVVTIEPPSDIQLIWSEDFVSSLNRFYETGNYHVPEKVSGRNFLILSEYFGIVHSPTKVTYESYVAFLQMKVWVDYLSRRAEMATYIVKQCMSRSKLTHTFVTTTDPSENTAGFSYYIDGRPCNDIFDGNLQTSPTNEGTTTNSCTGKLVFIEKLDFDKNVALLKYFSNKFTATASFYPFFSLYKIFAFCRCSFDPTKWSMIFSMTLSKHPTGIFLAVVNRSLMFYDRTLRVT